VDVVIGTGPLGLAVVRELLAKGKKVRVVNRSGKADVPANVDVKAGDIGNPEFAREACRSAVSIYLCAKPPYIEMADKFQPIMDGTIAAAAATTTGTLYALVNELKLDGNAHFLDVTSHAAADSVNAIAAPDADSVPKAITLVNEIFIDFVAHCIQAGVHFTYDVFTALVGTLATTGATAYTLANILKTFFESHRILTADSYENVAAGFGFEWPCQQPFYAQLSSGGSVSIRTHI